jgi:uncharacterized protein (TIGR02996 family)
MLTAALERDPGDDMAWLVLADALEEQGGAGAGQAEATRLSVWLRRRLDDPERPAWERRLLELLGQGVRPCLPRKIVSLAEGVELPLVLIPPGSFLMGSPESEAERESVEVLHQVTLTRGFWMGVYQVTQAQWNAILDANRSEFQGDTLPVEQASWNDCQLFLQGLNARTERQFRLPTESEWEYACRAGTSAPYSFGSLLTSELANYDAESAYLDGPLGVRRRRTTPVGSFPANPWGLFDMHGNLWEWCDDQYGSYPRRAIVDPVGGRRDEGEAYAQRGGSFDSPPEHLRSACRNHHEPSIRMVYFGCRVVLPLAPEDGGGKRKRRTGRSGAPAKNVKT